MQPTTVHCETGSWLSSHWLAASFSISRSAYFFLRGLRGQWIIAASLHNWGAQGPGAGLDDCQSLLRTRHHWMAFPRADFGSTWSLQGEWGNSLGLCDNDTRPSRLLQLVMLFWNSKPVFSQSMANALMRNALARFFGILERSGRYLMLGHVSRPWCSIPIRSGKVSMLTHKKFSCVCLLFVHAQDGHRSLSSQSRGLGFCPWSFEAHCAVSKAHLCGQEFAS